MYISKLTKIIIALLRPQTYLLLILYVIFGMSYSLAVRNSSSGINYSYLLINALLVFLAVAAWYISATSINDYSDFEIDKINLKNDKQRPLVQGQISKKQLLYIFYISSLLCIIFGFLTRITGIIILCPSMVILNILYSVKPIQFSHRGGLSPLLLPLGYIVFTVTSGVLLIRQSLDKGFLIIILAMYTHFMSRIVLKDHRDVVGDKKMGKKTLVLKYGNKKVITLSIILFSISIILLIYSTGKYLDKGYLYILILGGAGGWALLELYNEQRWQYQRPLLTIFGRCCSGIITLCIFYLTISVFKISLISSTTISILITTIFIWSIYNILLLQSPDLNAVKR